MQVLSSVLRAVRLPGFLKVTKFEIFYALNFHDFYTTKALWVADLCTKIKK
jgi:hypothetical protein